MAVPTSQTDVVIVGGGIGGLASALALTRTGLRIRVLERAAEFGEIGYGLQLAPNVTRVLRSWGLLDEIAAQGVLPRRLVMRDALDGTDLTYLDLAAVERRYGAPYVVVHRSDLHRTLVQACEAAGVELVTDTTVTDVEIGEDNAVAVSGERRDVGQVVLAADGLHSLLRGRVHPDELVSSSYVAYRGAIPMPGLGARITREDVVVYVGPYCHLVQYPLRHGEVFNQIAVFRSPRALAGQPDWGTPDELDAAFAATCEPVRAGLPHLYRERWWRMYDREPIDTWTRGRLALTGDAAHPMLQYLAQGACQAIEDAVCLGTLAAEHDDWNRTLADYTRVRAPRTARVQRTARAWGELWHCDGLFRQVRNALLTERDPEDCRYVDWLYGE